jgi:aspartate aminotransferase-like enzyme
MVAAQLKKRKGVGLILSNGEFGERLASIACRHKLTYDYINSEWGQALDLNRIHYALNKDRKSWVWFVHCETSTGMVNDLGCILGIAREAGCTIAVDCISSIGCVPLDLSQVDFATGVSGKGLGSVAGLAMVYHRENVPEDGGLPSTLDLGYLASRGIPHTIPSQLVAALNGALNSRDGNLTYEKLKLLSLWLREELSNIGLEFVVGVSTCNPAVLSLCCGHCSSSYLGKYLDDHSIKVNYQSQYLLQRNWVQMCLMGSHNKRRLRPLVELLRPIFRTMS